MIKAHFVRRIILFWLNQFDCRVWLTHHFIQQNKLVFEMLMTHIWWHRKCIELQHNIYLWSNFIGVAFGRLTSAWFTWCVDILNMMTSSCSRLTWPIIHPTEYINSLPFIYTAFVMWFWHHRHRRFLRSNDVDVDLFLPSDRSFYLFISFHSFSFRISFIYLWWALSQSGNAILMKQCICNIHLIIFSWCRMMNT